MASSAVVSVGGILNEIPAKSEATYNIVDVPIEFDELGTDVTIRAYYKVGSSSDVIYDEFTVHVDKASSLPDVKITAYVNPVTEELREYMEKSLTNITPFQLRLNGVMPCTQGGNYLFLKVEKGQNEVRKVFSRCENN